MYFVKTPKIFEILSKKYIIWKIKTKEKVIYLTFDDGPTPGITNWVLDTLKKHQVKATFFCVGENIEKYPEIYKSIINEGHYVGNHTFNHINGWITSTNKYLFNVLQCNELLNTQLFRPPYGKLKLSQLFLLRKRDYHIILWSVLTGDFDSKISPEKCLSNAIKNTKEGSIVMFHDNFKAKENLYYTLPLFIEHFINLGYKFNILSSEICKNMY